MPPAYQYDGLMSPRSKQGALDEQRSNYGYAPKSRVLYSRKGLGSAQVKRSKTGSRIATAKLLNRDQVSPYHNDDRAQYTLETKSRLNEKIMKRFNETPSIDAAERKSQVRSIFSKGKSQLGSKLGSNAGRSVFSQ